MNRFKADSYYLRDTLTATMQACTRYDLDGQTTFESYEHCRGLDHAIVLNVEEVAREVFGRRFIKVTTIGGHDDLMVHVHPHRRDAREVDLSMDILIHYSKLLTDLVTDYLDQDYNRTTSNLSHVFSQINAKLRDRLSSQYPGVTVSMTHRYAQDRKLSLQISVVASPRMPMKVAA